MTMESGNGEGHGGHLTICGWTTITPSGMCKMNEDGEMEGKMVFAWILERGKDQMAMDLSRELQSNQWLDW